MLPAESEGLLNDSWVAYQAHPGFVRESHPQATDRSAVLHAPLEPSPTGAHDALQASTAARSVDLAVLQSTEEKSAASGGWSGARRRVMQVPPPTCMPHACNCHMHALEVRVLGWIITSHSCSEVARGCCPRKQQGCDVVANRV